MKKKSALCQREEYLRFQNELKKMKMVLEYGATFGETPPGIPPEVESVWLDRILELEKACATSEWVAVYEKIGMPPYHETSDIPDHKIHVELIRLLKILINHGIYIESAEEVDDRVLYRYITEEVFSSVMQDISLPGYDVRFVYGE